MAVLKMRSSVESPNFLTFGPTETQGEAWGCVEGEGMRRELQFCSSEPRTRALGLTWEPEADHPLLGLPVPGGLAGNGEQAGIW